MKYLSKILISLLAVGGILTINGCKKDEEIESAGGGKVYYVSPEGKDSASGAENDPFDGYSGLMVGDTGDTVILKEGTYKIDMPVYMSKKGTAAKPITVKAAEGAKVVIDFSGMEFLSTNRGITVSGNYYHIEGLEVVGAGDNGMYISGSYNTIENCVFHDNRDTGLQIGRGGSSAYRPHAAQQSGDLYRFVRGYPKFVRDLFRCQDTRVQTRPFLLQRERRTMRGMQGCGRTDYRNEFPAGRVCEMQKLQWGTV